MKFELTGEQIHKILRDETLITKYSLENINFYDKIKDHLPEYLVFDTTNYKIMWISLNKLFGDVDFKVEYNSVAETLISEFNSVDFSILQFHDIRESDAAYIDEFSINYDFTQIENSIQWLIGDIIKIKNIINSYELIKPVSAGLVKKETENIQKIGAM